MSTFLLLTEVCKMFKPGYWLLRFLVKFSNLMKMSSNPNIAQ